MPGVRGIVIFRRLRHDNLVLFHDRVVTQITPYTQAPESALEAGGVLIGCYRGQHIEIVACTTPMKQDQRYPTRFERIDPGHQRVARRHWRDSGHRLTCVGEWHTHPVAFPTPSSIDATTWLRLLRENSYPLVFLIAGTQGTWCGFGRSGANVDPMEPLPAADGLAEETSSGDLAHPIYPSPGPIGAGARAGAGSCPSGAPN